MGRDETEAVAILTETMRDERLDLAVRVTAAAALLQWSTLESIARHFDSDRG